MSKSKKIFPNKWKAFADIPSDKYEPFPYDLFMDMKECWEIRRSHVCVIREVTPKGKIKEHSYKMIHAAKNKVNKLMANEQEFTVMTYDAIHQINPDDLFHEDY
tara:strand:+ start:868 stop:1179 length:312 start_codon:yes stop_codon:yes gene_type:complete